MITGMSGTGRPRQDDHTTLGDETTEIARIVADSAPGVERIPAAERVYAYVKAAILDRVYPGGELLTEGELADAVGPEFPELQCTNESCGRAYRIDDGVPVLLADEARSTRD